MTLPEGSVTFVFTDIEGSTRLARALGDEWLGVLDQHNELMRAAIAEHGGYEVKTEGDAFFIAFQHAADAVRTCVAAQRALRAAKWPPGNDIRVRIGMHTGAAHVVAGDYVGLVVHEAARIAGAGHGGQIVLSNATAEAAGDLDPKVSLLDLGLHALKDFPEPQPLFQVEHPALSSKFPPLRTLAPAKGNLPEPPHDLVGRTVEREVALDALSGGARLVTLTGPGGIGKTRLSIEIAHTLRGGLVGGAWFVALAGLDEDDRVLPAVAEVLGVQPRAGEELLDTVGAVLRRGPALAVIDNAEHLDGVAGIVQSLIEACPELQVMVTTRARLRLRAEHEVAVLPLGDEAVQLFAERARAAKPGFKIDDSNAADIAALCAYLDGVPLAIELAAARTRLFAPKALLERLQRDIGVLSGGARDLLAHQRTLRDAIRWSYDLLDDDTKAVLRRLAAFRGGASLTALEAVSEGYDALAAVDELVEQNLVTVAENADGEPRFGMLETIRQFAAEQLDATGECEVVEQAHASWFLRWAVEVEDHLIGPDQVQWYRHVDAEHDNLWAALDRLTDADDALTLTGSLARYWSLRGHWTEGRSALDRAISLDGGSPTARAKALLGAGHLAQVQGESAAAQRYFEASLAAARDGRDGVGEVRALIQLSEAARTQADPDIALKRAEEAEELAVSLGNDREVAQALHARAAAHLSGGEPDTATPLFEAALRVQQQLGEKRAAAKTLSNLGLTAMADGRLTLARDLFTEALVLNRSIGSFEEACASLFNLGIAAAREQDDAAAEPMWLEALELAERLGDRPRAAMLLRNLAVVAGERSDVAVALERYRRAMAVFRELGRVTDVAVLLLHAGYLAGTNGQLNTGREYLEEAIRVGQVCGADAVVRDAEEALAGLAVSR